MKIVKITRRSYFSASHRLHNPDLSDEENRALYGCCNNEYGHGHNYWLDVTVRGKVDERTGMVMNLDDLMRIIQDEVIARLDHKHINHDVAFMRGVIPTAENLVLKIWEILEAKIKSAALHEIRVFESPENSACYRGGK